MGGGVEAACGELLDCRAGLGAVDGKPEVVLAVAF